MATDGTNIVALQKPGVGTTAGPQWATDLNTSIDAVDGHDHSTNKGIRITPAAININSDLEFNQNSASELKNVIFDSSVTAASTSYSLYQASGNLYWRNGSGSAVQVTIAGAVNSGAGSITGMTGTDSGVSYADGSKTFNFFTDSGNGDYGKMAHADLLLFKYTNDNTGDTDYVTIAANSGVSGSSGTIYVPSENGTFLTTATSYAGAIAIATSSGNSNIDLTPHGTGEVNISKVDINGGTLGAITIDGNWTAASQTCANLGTVTTTGTIGLGGKLTAGSTEIEGSNFDINGGTIDATTVGASSQAAGGFTTLTATTLDTGQGANELYDMNQNVLTTSGVTHDKLTATTGVLFGTDTAAANTLDDYEEGTFTPTGTALLSATGRYTKIGRMVHVYWYTRNNSSATSRLNYAGLPFQAGSTGITTYSTGQMVAYAGNQGGQFLARIAKGTSGVVFTTTQTAAFDPTGAYLEIEFTLTYTID